MRVVELIGVGRTFSTDAGEVVALDAVDLVVDAGQLVVVLGPSGCGKTTLLNLLGALDEPTCGTARVAGHDLTTASRPELFAYRRDTISFVFQTFNLFPGLTAEENVRFGAEVTHRDDPAGIAATMLERVGLSARATHFPAQLSGGEQQRVAIARALVNSPAVLLADEPSGNLDTRNKEEVHRLFFDLRERLGQTIVLVTHDESLALRADRRIVMSDGLILPE